MFLYRNCIEWLNEQARQLELVGCGVAVIKNESQLPTFTIKVTTKTLLADLVIWEYGRASIQIFDLQKECFLIEQHDVELSNEGYQKELEGFFQTVSGRAKG